MKTRHAVLSASFAMLTALVSGQAAAKIYVTPEQANAIQVGETRAELIKALGQPEARDTWLNGTHSLVYEIRKDDQKVYVDLDKSGKVANVTIPVVQQE